jgi:hypothetical protein
MSLERLTEQYAPHRATADRRTPELAAKYLKVCASPDLSRATDEHLAWMGQTIDWTLADAVTTPDPTCEELDLPETFTRALREGRSVQLRVRADYGVGKPRFFYGAPAYQRGEQLLTTPADDATPVFVLLQGPLGGMLLALDSPAITGGRLCLRAPLPVAPFEVWPLLHDPSYEPLELPAPPPLHAEVL